jgi:hypothetical protein
MLNKKTLLISITAAAAIELFFVFTATSLQTFAYGLTVKEAFEQTFP